MGGAFLTGAVALGYEVAWTHVLAFLVGNTVYAFGSMLFTFLCGLGLGAEIVSRRLKAPNAWAGGLAASQLGLGLCVLISVPVWNFVPLLFATGIRQTLAYELILPGVIVAARMGYLAWRISLARSGASSRRAWRIELIAELLIVGCLFSLVRLSPFLTNADSLRPELARLLCAIYLLIVPCFLLGLSFPLLLNLSIHSAKETGHKVGGLYAVNTLGSILGSVSMGFILLPWLGSLTIRLCAVMNIALGLFFALRLLPLTPARRLFLALAASLLPVVFWLAPGQWNPARMTSGSYVYFDAGFDRYDHLLYYKEDTQGGLTSVIQRGSRRTMLTTASSKVTTPCRLRRRFAWP